MKECKICPICLEDLNNHTLVKTNCNHEYHFDCFIHFLSNNSNKMNCAICRQDIKINYSLFKKINEKNNQCYNCILKTETNILENNINSIENLLFYLEH